MRFTRLQVKNWKNFRHADVALASRVFVIGPNASGKSNLLEVFRFLRDVALPGGGLVEAVRIRGGMKAIRSVHARANSAVEILVELELSNGTRWSYELVFTKSRPSDDSPVVQREVVRILNGPEVNTRERVVLNRPDGSDAADAARLTQTALEQTNSNKDFREIAEFFRSVSYLHLVPQVVREGAVNPSHSIGPDSMGRDLLDRMKSTNQRTRMARLRRMEKVLQVAAPQFKELQLDTDEKGRPHLKIRFSHWRPNGAFQDESQFSDGTLRLIGILWSVQERGGPLLLEEPELSLHKELVSRLAPFLHRAQREAGGRQVILSTHSSDLLSDPGIASDEVIWIEPQSEGSAVRLAAEDEVADRLMSEAGLTASEVLLPRTAPTQLELFDALT